MQNIQSILKSSLEYKKLIELIKGYQKQKGACFVIVKGTTIPIQELVINLIEKETSSSFVYSMRYSKALQSYLEDLVIIDKQFTFAGLTYTLNDNGFEKVPSISQKGEFSQKGDIVTLWPIEYFHPIRVSYWGEEIETIEVYDEIYGSKIQSLDKFILGNIQLLDHQYDFNTVQISNQYLNLIANPKIIFSNQINKVTNKSNIVTFDFTYPSLFFKRLDILQDEINKKQKNNWNISIFSKHKSQIPKILHKYLQKEEISSGFESQSLKTVVYTDREIFGTIFVSSEREKQKTKSQKEINKFLAQLEGEIEINDYIVHEDYGVAIYKGIKQQESLGEIKDFLILEYAENDTLYVPMGQIHKLTKYIGPENVTPKITRLGKGDWNTIKTKVKKSVGIAAKELLRHYALRELTKGYKFKHHEWEDKFGSEFEFEETEDQKRVINEMFADMESKKPMDRLLVGDVGFGKTEVAIRAAFKAVMSEKQVAVLCPTTILVSQHYQVFKHRMRNYPIEIKTLSRFGTKKENEQIVDALNVGDVDIVIGTHRLLSNDIKFKNLGLLILDEEQRFGVKQKEKIKKISYGIDVLAMSATPIPRTLSMSLSGIRDISLITTPPPGRKSTKTIVDKFNWNRASEAILNEVNRDGQVFFVHNEVRTIESIKGKLQQILPEVKSQVAHGQMHPMTLDKIMRDFYEHKFDCLISTTIIENGIDIKNVNTMIVNRAQNFGLSQLYQLRGRIGRGSKQAYCYLYYTGKSFFAKTTQNKKEDNFVETKTQIRKKKTQSYDKWKDRLQAMLDAQELGAGFKVASRDLEIRGAGNLLGQEQHGNISAVGFGLYSQMLREEIEKLRQK